MKRFVCCDVFYIFLTQLTTNGKHECYRGGWHHVEVHEDDWWIRKYESYGFQYDEILTQEIRQVAKNDRGPFPPNGENLNAQHVWMSMKVFINPVRTNSPDISIDREERSKSVVLVPSFERFSIHSQILHRISPFQTLSYQWI